MDRLPVGCSDGLSDCPFHAMMRNIMSCRDEMMVTREVMSSSRLACCGYDLIFFFFLQRLYCQSPGAVKRTSINASVRVQNKLS